MMGLTQRQADCLAFIRRYIHEQGRSPAYSDIACGLGLRSQAGVRRLVLGLRRRGHIDFVPHAARSIVLRAAPSPHPSPRKRGEGAAARSGGAGEGERVEVGLALPPALAARLDAFCEEHGDAPDDVIADAVALHIDSFGASAEREAIAMFAAAFEPPPPLPRWRCCGCDNGVETEWTYCPFCGAQERTESVAAVSHISAPLPPPQPSPASGGGSGAQRSGRGHDGRDADDGGAP